jgi:LysR family transcriptional regulator, nitrogen assimilation regulatory protein
MDLTKARYFIKIVDTGSMTRAAEVLNVSASALSKATKSLERQLGVDLVALSGKNIVITDSGLLFAKEARRLLREADELQDLLRRRAEPRQTIRIATFEVFSTYFLSALKDLPWDDQSLVLHDCLPGQIERAVADNQVDFGITYHPLPLPEIDLLNVAAIEMGVYTNASAFKNVNQMELPFVVPVEPLGGALPTRIRGLDGWPSDAYERRVKYQVTLMESALELVRQGRAAGYFPKFVAAEHNRRHKEEFHLLRRRTPYPGRVCTTNVYLIKRRSDKESDVLKQIAKQIRRIGQI